MTITATQVKALREKTGAGMMACKQALSESSGDMAQAIDLLRTKGAAKALKKSDRVAAEGIIALACDSDQKKACLVELNSETDFVAREAAFSKFATELANQALKHTLNDTTALLECVVSGSTLEQRRIELIAQLGENISLRRVQTCCVQGGGVVGAYLHGHDKSARIGALVVLDKENSELAGDIAMHVAAMQPSYLDVSDIPTADLEKEKKIILGQVAEQVSGKPQAIVEKIVEGKIQKWQKENTLLGQSFVKDPDKTIESLLSVNHAKVLDFIRFEVGKGIEKISGDFVEEVMSQVQSKH